MAYDIGSARGVIELGYNGKGVEQAKTDLGEVEKKGGLTESQMRKTSSAFLIAGTAVVGALGLAVNSAANFEQRMSAIGAVSGATSKEMDGLRNKALQLGKDTQFSASESAQAIEELIKAGLSVEDVLNGAADATVNLAAAGAIDMPTAATISANAMNQFGLAAKDMVGVVDNIAGAANASAIDVNEFGQALQQVGAVAHLNGISFRDTATAIALMGNAGIKGSDAGTSLKTMFQNLQPSTKRQTEAFKELGLITEDGTNKFFDAQGNMKDLGSVAQVLQNSLKGLTSQQKSATLELLFGTDAIRGAAILSNAGAKGFDKMASAMGKVSAADVAAKRMDNFKGSLEQMKGSLETLGITLGTLLLPPLRDLVDGITNVLNAFLSLPGGAQAVIVVFTLVVGVILLVIGAIMKFILFQRALQVALAGTRLAFISTWLAALGPIALVIAAIALVAIAIAILWAKSETFRNIVIGVWNAIKAAAQAVGDWFTGTLVPSLVSAWQGIITALNFIKSVFVAVWAGIVAAVQFYINLVATVIRTYIAIWTAIITGGLNVLKAIWGAIWQTFGGIITAVFGLIVAIVRLYLTIVFVVVMTIWNNIRAVTSAVWNGIVGVIRAVWGIVAGVARAGAANVRAVVSAAWNAIRAVTSAIWNGVMAVVRAVWGRIGGTVTAGASRARGVVVGAWNAVRSATSSAWNAVVGAVRTAIGHVVSLASGLKGKIVGFFSGAGGWLISAGKNIIQGLINGIESMISTVTSKLNSLTAKIKSAKGPEEKDKVLLESNGETIMRSLVQGFDNETPQVLSTLDDLTNSILRGFDRATPDVASTVTDIVGAIASGFSVGPVAIGDLTDMITANLPSGSPSPASPAAPAPTPTAGGDSGALRLIDGELRLDPSGRAFIHGIAVEAIDGSNDYEDLLGRMG